LNEIQFKAFVSELRELEKTAGLTDFIPKLLSWGSEVSDAYKAKGFVGALDTLEKYKTPAFQTLNNGTMTVGNELKNTGWLQKGIGDSVSAFRNLGSGISTENTLFQNAKNFGGNIWTTVQDQLRDARFKTVDLDANKNIITKDGKQFLKGKFGLPDRPILGTSADGAKGIVKKRALAQVGAMSVTPVGFGIQSALFPSNKTENGTQSNSDGIPNRIGRGLKDTALWTVARPAAEVGMGVDILKSFKKKNNEQQSL
jgi:hypothetical protein